MSTPNITPAEAVAVLLQSLNQPQPTVAQMAPASYVLIPLAATVTGLTEKAIRVKIEEGVWLEGREYRRGPDGRIYISLRGYEQWVEAGKGLMSAKDRFKQRSRLRSNSPKKGSA